MYSLQLTNAVYTLSIIPCQSCVTIDPLYSAVPSHNLPILSYKIIDHKIIFPTAGTLSSADIQDFKEMKYIEKFEICTCSTAQY